MRRLIARFIVHLFRTKRMHAQIHECKTAYPPLGMPNGITHTIFTVGKSNEIAAAFLVCMFYVELFCGFCVCPPRLHLTGPTFPILTGVVRAGQIRRRHKRKRTPPPTRVIQPLNYQKHRTHRVRRQQNGNFHNARFRCVTTPARSNWVRMLVAQPFCRRNGTDV